MKKIIALLVISSLILTGCNALKFKLTIENNQKKTIIISKFL